ncbi:MAG TPA: hypothetical protein VFZ34_02965 [Blastocatellia bacterium]|nr:hypothetical protein [Blastocatellia bacterium]
MDGVVTAPRSPYQVRFSVSGRANPGDSADKDRFGFPQNAWTYAHVVVRKLILAWGPSTLIPRDRADVPMASPEYKKKDRETELKDLQRRQKVLVQDLAKFPLSPGKGDPTNKSLELRLNVPKFDIPEQGDYWAKDEHTYFRDMWGDGPLIPLVVRAYLKRVNGKLSTDRKGLGRAQFLWEWQDNENEDLEARIKPWLTHSSGITKSFIKEVFALHRNPKFPCHGWNCPQKYGGKRGTDRPAPTDGSTPVFHPPDKKMGAEVTYPLKQRDWGAVSVADPSLKLRDRNKKPASSTILFQPSTVAGDRFRVSVCFVPESLDEMDVDLVGGNYYDLMKEAEKQSVPWANTYYFDVWRTIHSAYYYSPSFAKTCNTTVDAIEKQLERELGFKATIARHPLPDLRSQHKEQMTHVIRTDKNFNAYCRSVFLHVALSLPRGDADYALDEPLDCLTSVQELFQKGKWLLLHGVDNACGQEILGARSKTRALVSYTKVNYEDQSDLYPVLLLDGEAFELGEDWDAGEGNNGSTAKGTIKQVIEPVIAHWGIKVQPGQDHHLSKRDIKVAVHGIAPPLDLRYDEGEYRPTRQLTDARIKQLEVFAAKLKNHRDDQELVITVTGVDMKGREKERAEQVIHWLQEHSLDTKEVMYQCFAETFTAFKPKDKEMKDIANWGKPVLDAVFIKFRQDRYNGITMAWRTIFNLAFIAAALQGDKSWETEGRAIFYHLRGRTHLDKGFTTGGIENYMCTERLGIAGITQPAVTMKDRVEKRWLKAPDVVVAHEFGHVFMLRHSAPQLLDSKIASGTKAHQHLAHDSCLMNYDADTVSFCGWCMLRKRGWLVEDLMATGIGDGMKKAWVDECRKQLEADAVKGPANKVRYAMFLLDLPKFDASVNEQSAEAIKFMKAARSEVPENKDDEQHIWLLRCEVVFYDKLSKSGPTDLRVSHATLAKSRLDKLLQCSSFGLDFEDLQNSKGEVEVNRLVASNWIITGG